MAPREQMIEWDQEGTTGQRALYPDDGRRRRRASSSAEAGGVGNNNGVRVSPPRPLLLPSFA